MEYTPEEEALFEKWLQSGEGSSRIRLVTPDAHSSFKVGTSLVLNLGTNGLIDPGEECVGFHLAPPRTDGGAIVLDCVLHPEVLQPSASTPLLRRIADQVLSVARNEYPDAIPADYACSTSQVQPQPLAQVALEIPERQLRRGRDVLRRAIEQKKGNPPLPVVPARANAFGAPPPIQPALVLVCALASACGDASGVVVYFEGQTFEVAYHAAIIGSCSVGRPGSGQEEEDLSQYRAFYLPRRRKVIIRKYADETDARAAGLQKKLVAARKKRARLSPATLPAVAERRQKEELR
ncbi:hypothetical protein DIPPA_05787 [Diplonema papillatum]|nr:hypothetical protein DIPPA_05787 [Diplonema papillatum]